MRTLTTSTLLTFSCLVLAACESAAAPSSPVAKGPSSVFGRPTPLSFGMYVSPDPAENPISPPERFTGYHVGLDLEVSENELEKDVFVYAVCDGPVVFSGFAEGYGGLVTQSCTLKSEEVTVIYGHLTIAGLPENGTELRTGQQFATLGAANSEDSGGTRKHLHLGIHRGGESDVRGYVQSEADLSEFLNPKDALDSSPMKRGWFMTPYWKTLTEDKTESD